MKLKSNLKDWEIAREVFGKNTKRECNLIKNLRKNNYNIIIHSEDYYLLITETDDIGWLIPSSIVEFN